MEQFDDHLPAIELVFAGSYLNHINALTCKPDHREKLLVDLLSSYLKGVLVSPTTKQLYDSFTLFELAAVHKLLNLWSEDLVLIYQIRENQNGYLFIGQLAQRFLQRVTTLENCTIIPNGLISAGHTRLHEQYFENVSLAILRKQGGHINWTQVDPGSAYHQHCEHVAGEKSNSYLEITEINPDNITEDWLSLLVGLKAVRCKSQYYKNVSLYECLLSHLNGKAVFQSELDEGFIAFSHESPEHTWQVVHYSFRYLLRHFLGDAYQVVYQHLITGFKLFLMDKTLAAYQSRVSKQMKLSHFLLQEMCRNVAQQAFDQGNEAQKEFSFQLINKAKAAIEQHYSKQEELVCRTSQLDRARVLSLSFVPPNVINRSYSSNSETSFDLQVDTVFKKPYVEDDVIDYLENFNLNFIEKLKDAKDINKTALLSYGIEVFFIEYLADTNILDRSPSSPFSRNDVYLAHNLQNLAEIYYGCQSRIVNDFLKNMTYEPQFYAKNVTVQFFAYAAIAALNYRDPCIGPLLATYNLSVSLSKSFTLEMVIPQLVIEDSRWTKVLLAVKAFFTPKTCEGTLFSGSMFAFEVKNDADRRDTNVRFAYQLLQKYPSTFKTFAETYRDIEDEKLNHKWSSLTYKATYLPSLYFVLSKIAYFAKLSLTGFPSCTNRNDITAKWSVFQTTHPTWSSVTGWGPPQSAHKLAASLIFHCRKLS